MYWNVRGLLGPHLNLTFKCYCYNKTHTSWLLWKLEFVVLTSKRYSLWTSSLLLVFSRATWLCGWNAPDVELEPNYGRGPQWIHGLVEVLHHNHSYLFSTIYTSTKFATRKDLWQELMKMSRSVISPWLIVGDFNVWNYRPNWKNGGKTNG